MNKIISVVRFLTLVALCFVLSFTLGVVFADDATAALDVTIFGGLLLSLIVGVFD